MANAANDPIESLVFSPPTMGLNSRDSISNKDPSYAEEAINYFSNGATVDYRPGFRYFAKNLTSTQITSMFEYARADGTRNLLVVSDNGGVYDVSAGGGVPVFLGNTTGMQTKSVNFKNKIFMKDRFQNSCKVWDGTTFASASFTGPGGADVLLANPTVYDQGIYFIGQDLSIWFGKPNFVTGPLQQFAIDTFCTKGGRLLFCGPTNNVGTIASKLFCMITDQGEISVFSGGNPTTTDWGEIGHYYMPSPCGYKSFLYWGSDLLIMTGAGVFRLTDIMSGVTPLIPFTDAINDLWIQQWLSSPNADAIWAQHYPNGNMIIFNMLLSNGNSCQFVYNTYKGSWWRWESLPSGAMSLFQDNLYFGCNIADAVAKFGGDFDEDLASKNGTPVSRLQRLRPAYNYLGDRETNKKFVSATATVIETQGLSLNISADVDFQNTNVNRPMTDATVTSSKVYQRPQTLVGARLGKAVSVRFDDTITQKTRQILAIEVQYKSAGTLGANPL